MIYITGDPHAEFPRFFNKRLRIQGFELTEQDYMIVCGDYGLCWARDKTFEYTSIYANRRLLKKYLFRRGSL